MRKLNRHIKNMVSSLKSDGINFYFDNETTICKNQVTRLENVVFEKDGLKFKICEGIFFRDFGQCKYFKQFKDEIKLVDYTDNIFYNEQEIVIRKWFANK